MAVPESQRYASAFYTLWQGHALWIPQPNSNLGPEYSQIGVRIGDVGLLNADGSFDYLFNVCHPPDDPINRLSGKAPTHFEELIWNGLVTEKENVFPSGSPIMSHVGRDRSLGGGATATLPAIPVGVGAGFGAASSMGQSAVILPHNGAHSTDCVSLARFCNYAKEHGFSWYAHVREVLEMQVLNGDIFFITGFNKTKRWENALFSHNMRDRVFNVAADGGSLAGVFGHHSRSDSRDIFISRRSPPDNEYYNQALFIRGFRVSLHGSLTKKFLGPVKIKSTDPSWKDTSGKRSGGVGPEIPPRGQESSSESNPPSSGSHSHQEKLSSTQSLSSDIADISQLADARYIVDNYKEDPLSQVYDPSRAINDFIAQSMSDKDDCDAIITHDKYWVALLTDQDIEMPTKQELLRRLEALLLDHKPHKPLSISADDILALLLLETAEAFGILSNIEPARIPPVLDYLQAEAKSTDLNNVYGQKCMKILYDLVEKHDMFPPSLLVNEVTLESLISGPIYKGTYQKNPVCLKVSRCDHEELCKEAFLWNQINHPNILPFLGVNITLFFRGATLVVPWMVNGSITRFLKNNDSHDRLRVLSEIAAGLKYLHSQNIVHNSIRGEKILVDEQGKCHISDFGLAESAIAGNWLSARDRPVRDISWGWAKESPLRWMAPEFLPLETEISTFSMDRKKSPEPPLKPSDVLSRDIYAYACTVYEIMADEIPFAHVESNRQVVSKVTKGERPERPKADTWCPDNIWALVKQCWAQKSHLRPTASAVHGFLSRLEKLRVEGLPWEKEFPDPVQEKE